MSAWKEAKENAKFAFGFTGLFLLVNIFVMGFAWVVVIYDLPSVAMLVSFFITSYITYRKNKR